MAVGPEQRHPAPRGPGSPRAVAGSTWLHLQRPQGTPPLSLPRAPREKARESRALAWQGTLRWRAADNCLEGPQDAGCCLLAV